MRKNSEAVAVVDCKIRELSSKLEVFQGSLDRLFCSGMDDIDMPRKMRMSKILMKIDRIEDEYLKMEAANLLRRYATVKFAIKNLKEVRDRLME